MKLSPVVAYFRPKPDPGLRLEDQPDRLLVIVVGRTGGCAVLIVKDLSSVDASELGCELVQKPMTGTVPCALVVHVSWPTRSQTLDEVFMDEEDLRGFG